MIPVAAFILTITGNVPVICRQQSVETGVSYFCNTAFRYGDRMYPAGWGILPAGHMIRPLI